MKAYQRFTKAYKLVDSNGNTVGEYTTVDGCTKAADRRNLKDWKIEPNY